VEFELARAPHLLLTMDYSYRERHGEAIYRFRDGMLPSDFFHRNVVLSFREGRHRHSPTLTLPLLLCALSYLTCRPWQLRGRRQLQRLLQSYRSGRFRAVAVVAGA
jgi:hypothetical protein